MSRNQQFASMKVFLAAALLAAGFAAVATADPLPGRDKLKFSQLPMIDTPVNDNNGTVQKFNGHDELSTAYGFFNTAINAIPSYDGRFMADDFADLSNDPVLHVKWWGSYLLNNPNVPVNKFLISFESDTPAGPAPSFSHPDQPLLNQVVFKGPLAPGSGTYTETLLPGTTSVDGPIYEYNAELHLNKPFPEKADTVYWLKIAAMVDVPAAAGTFDPYNPQTSLVPMTQWGWHNRDYTMQDTLASTSVAGGGEILDGNINGTSIYHFQDDAVTGDVRINVLGSGGLVMPDVFQPVANMLPTFYKDGIDGPAGAVPGAQGISHFSKDLAFNLYTYQVPEPSSCLLMLMGLVGLFRRRR